MGSDIDSRLVSSPRQRGCFSDNAEHPDRCRVFPACAGVFLTRGQPARSTACLPRARGGVSMQRMIESSQELSSPPSRGCFRVREPQAVHDPIFPAFARVLLWRLSGRSKRCCLPRVRGGVSRSLHAPFMATKSSPRSRGCFQRHGGFYHVTAVFPAFVGVPTRRTRHHLVVFPAFAGVFLVGYLAPPVTFGLPRIRGGVSDLDMQIMGMEGSSPHSRGCFWHYRDPGCRQKVFPAFAGVFPWSVVMGALYRRLPRIRGGVSESYATIVDIRPSSPHSRGCFHVLLTLIDRNAVFPAFAGVFLGHLYAARG